MENYKELLSEYTKCTENVREYVYGFGSGNKRYEGQQLTPFEELDPNKAKWLGLSEVATEDLDWINDVFPNIKVLEIRTIGSLKSLKGIEKLKLLDGLVIHPKATREQPLDLRQVKLQFNELLLWNCLFDISNLQGNFNYAFFNKTQLFNENKITSLSGSYLKIYNCNKEDNSPIESNFEGEMNTFKFENHFK